MVFILMGVSGAGKTLIGKLLAERLNLPFYDGDNFHPEFNVNKMKSGQPLNDDDRRPWLRSLALNIQMWNHKGGAVLACSALKKRYREQLKSYESDVQFIYLKGPQSLIAKRLKQRGNHYMPAELLNSQFETLEEPNDAITVMINQSPKKIVEEILNAID